MSKTVIVSKKLPIQVSSDKINLEYRATTDNLINTLKSIKITKESIWVGWSGIVSNINNQEKVNISKEELRKENCISVELTQKDINNYYHGFSNKTIWPLFHYFPEYADFEQENWKSYKLVNQKYADVILENIEEGDTIWIHDYYLFLLPEMIRKKLPNVSIGFFLHIPFPNYEIFKMLPWMKNLIVGILGADLIGFHTNDYKNNFLDCIDKVINTSSSLEKIFYRGRIIKVNSFPMGIDYNKFSKASMNQKNNLQIINKNTELNLKTASKPKLILSIDRLDYTKGITNRIKAFEYFLEQNPKYIGQIILIMHVHPSRSYVSQYQILKKEIDELIGKVNGKFTTNNWKPIKYFFRPISFNELIHLYTLSDIALITPIRDGMNLAAKQYIASRIDQKGVLILSNMAGAAKEMSKALLVNPNNFEQTANAIKKAIEMTTEEQIKRNISMQSKLRENTIHMWAHKFITTLKYKLSEIPTQSHQSKVYKAKKLLVNSLE